MTEKTEKQSTLYGCQLQGTLGGTYVACVIAASSEVVLKNVQDQLVEKHRLSDVIAAKRAKWKVEVLQIKEGCVFEYRDHDTDLTNDPNFY